MTDVPKTQTGVGLLLSLINRQIERYAEDSKQLAQSYWDSWNALNEQKPMDRGRLGVRVLYQQKSGSLSLCWYQRRLVRKEKGFTVEMIYVPKGAQLDEYRENRIAKFARSWEIELFKQIEPKFVAIRRRVRQLNKLRTAVKRLDRVLRSETQDWDEITLEGMQYASECDR